MKLATPLLLSALATASLLAACSGKPTAQPPPPPTAAPLETTMPEVAPPATATPTAAPAPTPSAAASAAPTAPPAKPEWSKMSKEQKLELMKAVLTPKMTASFQGFDAKRYAKFDCATCHGAGVKDGKFAMPNPGLPKLTTTGKFEAEMKKSPKATKYMMDKVVPEVAGALGVPPYDPTTKQGFGCFNCHPKAG